MSNNNFKKTIRNSFIVNEIKTILKWRKYKPLNCYPQGHFYSPVVSKNEIEEYEDQIWKDIKEIPGIDLNLETQLSLLKKFEEYYDKIPFKHDKAEGLRYYFNNQGYSYTDAIMLYSFIQHFKPENIIEIGSGFSSTVMLDTKDSMETKINIQFIEPYPQLLYSLFKKHDFECKVYDTKVQSVPLQVFSELKENDILFIDSSHVSKTGSDVNFEIFQILPVLNSGVIIHIHDIFYPFEYPKEWVRLGRNWNEDYLVKAFLMYNKDYEILLFSDYIHKHHKSAFKNMPLTYKNTGGGLWLRKR